MSFEHAPVSKGLMIASGATSFTAGLFDLKHYFHLQFVPHISRHHQYWRLFTHHLAFTNSSDLLIAELVFYNVGVQVERRYGSVKFASFIFISTLLSTLLEFAALLLFHNIGLNHIPAGPIALLFSILYQYSRIVPPSYHFRIFGIPFTNKIFFYVLVLQLAVSRLPGSLAVTTIGILAGQIYRSDLANFKTYRIPPYVVRFATTYLFPLIGSTRSYRRSNLALPNEGRSGNEVDGFRAVNTDLATNVQGTLTGGNIVGTSIGTTAGTSASVVREWVNELTGRGEAEPSIRAPSETEISRAMLVFPNLQRDVVVGALQRSPNIESAIETLLNSQ